MNGTFSVEGADVADVTLERDVTSWPGVVAFVDLDDGGRVVSSGLLRGTWERLLLEIRGASQNVAGEEFMTLLNVSFVKRWGVGCVPGRLWGDL